ncbi:MAG: MbnP family copper-binding protein [Woeseia sp.]
MIFQVVHSLAFRYWLVLGASSIAGCSAPQQPVEIPFEVRFGDRQISCDSEIADIALTDLRFYIHDVRLLTAKGDESPVTLQADPLWQSDEVALLDFESGDGNCLNGTQQINTLVRGHAAAGNYTGLSFRVGVPERLNHADPLLADPPLGYSFMHWHWRTGYKFLRAGVASVHDGFWLHLGSSRCEGTATDGSGCRTGNRPEIRLPSYRPGEDVVVIDLLELVVAIDLQDGVPSDCSSGPAEKECEKPFDALGIDFETGEIKGGAPAFRVGTRE